MFDKAEWDEDDDDDNALLHLEDDDATNSIKDRSGDDIAEDGLEAGAATASTDFGDDTKKANTITSTEAGDTNSSIKTEEDEVAIAVENDTNKGIVYSDPIGTKEESNRNTATATASSTAPKNAKAINEYANAKSEEGSGSTTPPSTQTLLPSTEARYPCRWPRRSSLVFCRQQLHFEHR